MQIHGTVSLRVVREFTDNMKEVHLWTGRGFFLCKKRSLFLGMIQFAIAGNVTDGSHLRITCFDELCALAGCKGTDVYLQSGI